MEQILSGLTDEQQIEESPRKKKKKRKNLQALPLETTETTKQTTELVSSSSLEKQEPLAVELSSLSSGAQTRYFGDVSPLPFLAQKINFEDTKVASQFGIRFRRFGQSLIWYDVDDDQSKKGGSQRMLECVGKLKPGETIKGMNDWIFRVAGIDKVTSDRLMKVYFAYIHPGLPVINKTMFLKQYRGEIGDYPSPALLNSMYGAAVRYIETCQMFGDEIVEYRENVPDGWSESLFDNLLVFFKQQYSPCVSSVQAMVIGQNHRASLDEKMTSGWLVNASAIRMAQDLGLHRSSEGWDVPDCEKETRRRVWWSVYIMDKWFSAGMGRPQTIFDEDCDELYPNESATWEEVMDVSSDESLDEQDDEPRFPSLDPQVAHKVKGEKIPIYQPFVQLIKLSEILGRVLQGLYTPKAKKHSAQHGSDALVKYLDNALSEWRAALPPALQISSVNVRRLDGRGRMPLLSMSGLIYLSYCTLLILLHRPFIENENEQKTRSSLSSLSICTSAATQCVNIAEKMHYRDFLLVSWSFAIYPVFTAALIHVYNAGNPDTIVSDVGRANLVKAVMVVKRLSKFSLAAGQLVQVLQKLMEVRQVSVDNSYMSDDESSNEEEEQKKQQQNVGPQVSEVRHGSSPTAGTLPDTEIQTSCGNTPTLSVISGDWIHGLYSSMQPNSSQPTSAAAHPNALETDPHSLRQFGLTMEDLMVPAEKMQSSASVQQPQQQYEQQQVPLSNLTMSYNPAENFCFGIPNSGASTNTPPALQPFGAYNNPFNMSAQDTAPVTPMPAAAGESLFRNRPDNPFWSVPSSIELADWSAYLLPQETSNLSQQHQQVDIGQRQNMVSSAGWNFMP
ncbi:hypothetical protein DFQ28_006684 [Apophysomyces sp. BC1034]|nr:hypothetical protein DFQ28_006684 [Apophysomyces sp. BC1034]